VLCSFSTGIGRGCKSVGTFAPRGTRTGARGKHFKKILIMKRNIFTLFRGEQMDPNDFQSITREELDLLRQELFRLKECQNFFINLGFTISSGLLAYLVIGGGVVQTFSDLKTEPSINIIYLIPLVIILPIWLIFFDKATTISRIVGYYMILEQFIQGKLPQDNYLGWENSLNLLRSFNRKQEKCIKKTAGDIKLWEDLTYFKKISYLLRTLFIQRSSINQYRKIVFLGFFILSLMCLFFCIAPLFIWMVFTGTWPGLWLFNHFYGLLLGIIFLYIVIVITKYNLKILYQLARGFHSYSANYMLWHELLIKGTKPSDVDLSQDGCQFDDHWIDRVFPVE
jgi:hypothetical protein